MRAQAPADLVERGRRIGSARLDRLPAYVFAELDRLIGEQRAAGVDVISLGIGDPDLPTPAAAVSALQQAAAEPRNHRYASYRGLGSLRAAMAAWYSRRFGVDLDQDREVLPLLGSKEGIGHLAFALLDQGDLAVVPDPGYPVYAASSLLAGGEVHAMPLLAERGWQPDLEAIPSSVLGRARVLWLNYPNNPTGAVASLDFLAQAVEFSRRHRLVLAHDAAYTEVTFGGYRAPSVMQAPGAREVAVEFHSLSKTFNMTGWRVGMVVGNPAVLDALATVKENLDSGIFQAVQEAAVAALALPPEVVERCNEVVARRQQRAVAALRSLGWPVQPTPATFYLWFALPPVAAGLGSLEFTRLVLQRTGVVITPGVGLGRGGEGYLRISLTLPDDRLDEALRRLASLSA
jgi:LL-diaminopimelate aminotransferase